MHACVDPLSCPCADAAQEKLDLTDEQRAALAASHRRYRGALGALAKERASINAALAAAAAPGKDGMKKVHCLGLG
jgi:hypothetical protein